MSKIGIKYDSEKPDYSLLPFGTIDEVVKVLTYGANKYDRFNWEKVEPRRYQAAAMRHISAYMQGEKYDPESGVNHLAHAICSLIFLTEFDLKAEKKVVYNEDDSVYNISIYDDDQLSFSFEPDTITLGENMGTITVSLVDDEMTFNLEDDDNDETK